MDLEDCVGALFQASQYFVELSVVERDPENLLELDVVATNYDGDEPTSVLAEAKSGKKWGYGEIFKLLGWMNYLNIPRGVLFTTKPPPGKEIDAMKARVERLGISVIKLDSPALAQAFTDAGFPEIAHPKAIDIWRFVYAIQRAMIEHVRHLAKVQPDLTAPHVALGYHEIINNQVFFEPDPRESLLRLYVAFQEHPRLALGAAREIDGKGFDCETEDPSNKLIWNAIYKGDFDLIQACFYLEHRARLAILKAAVDICVLETKPKAKIKVKGKVVLTQDDFLPKSFRNGLRELSEHKYFKRYAVFWQVFLWGFGGFYLEDRQDTEFEHLAEHTGVPPNEIPNALTAFDLLFPTTGSWLASVSNTSCKVVKMMPMALQGIGAHHREVLYGIKSYGDLGYEDMTARDLSKWHNKGYKILKQREVDQKK